MGPSWLSLEKSFQNKGSQKAGKCYFEIGFCNYNIRSYPKSTLGPAWFFSVKNFQNEGFQKAVKCYFKMGVCVFSTDIQAL